MGRKLTAVLGFLFLVACGESSTNDSATDGGSGTGGSGGSGASGGSGGSGGTGGTTGGAGGTGGASGGSSGSGGATGGSGGSTGGSAGSGGSGGVLIDAGACPGDAAPGLPCALVDGMVCTIESGLWCEGDLQCLNGKWMPLPSWACACGPSGMLCSGNDVCVESAAGAGVSHGCVPNPCPGQPLACSCGASACGGGGFQCVNAADGVLYCSCLSCP